MSYYGGIEAGGTKFICCIGDSHGNIIDSQRIETVSPEETIPKVIAFFKKFPQIKSIGIGSFGPVDLDETSETYGFITDTPKTKWRNFDFLGEMKFNFDIPMGFETDVNVAALGEYTWGAAKGLSDFLYITVGTGVGVGHIVNHEFAHGLTHPEMGHMLVSRSLSEKEDFKSVCPYHSNCLEGMAAGPSVNTRWEVEHSGVLPIDHVAWEIESDYLAQALMNYILICSPKKIIMGGGVMHQSHLFPMIRSKTKKLLNGYISHSSIINSINNFIVSPGLRDESGMKGSIALAMRSLKKSL